MRSHRNDAGQILLAVPAEVVGPFRNAMQKLAGGVDFFALDAAERNSLDEALRHLWNPGDEQQASRERTVPIEVLALAMKDRRASQLTEAALPRMAAASRAQIPMDHVEALRREASTLPPEEVAIAVIAANAANPAGSRHDSSAPAAIASLQDARPTVELSPQDLPASPLPLPLPPPPAPGERTSATKSDGYRAPTKGRHTDVSR